MTEEECYIEVGKLTFRYTDRMNDIDDTDTAENILEQFTKEFENVWRPRLDVIWLARDGITYTDFLRKKGIEE